MSIIVVWGPGRVEGGGGGGGGAGAGRGVGRLAGRRVARGWARVDTGGEVVVGGGGWGVARLRSMVYRSSIAALIISGRRPACFHRDSLSRHCTVPAGHGIHGGGALRASGRRRVYVRT
jgi:hypothetical protein